MKIATINLNGKEVASIITEFGFLPIPIINKRFNKNIPHDLFSILNEDKLEEIKSWFYEIQDSLSQEPDKLFVDEKEVEFINGLIRE